MTGSAGDQGSQVSVSEQPTDPKVAALRPFYPTSVPKKSWQKYFKKKKPPQFLSSIWAPTSSDLSRDYADYPLFWLAPNLDKVQGLNMPRAPSRLSQTQLVIPSWSHFRTLGAQSLERRKKYMTPTYRHRHRRRKRLHGFDKLERERVYLQEQQ